MFEAVLFHTRGERQECILVSFSEVTVDIWNLPGKEKLSHWEACSEITVTEQDLLKEGTANVIPSTSECTCKDIHILGK